MQLHTINTEFFKLDGGAMFGVVPKSIWHRLNPADSNNMCTWAMRCLLIENGKQLILIDTGLGNKQSEKFFSYYYIHGNDTLEKSLHSKGFHPDDITDVILTHLHFDHCGGAVAKAANGALYPAFKNATYWSTQSHWEWATHPNPREKSSFLKENFSPILESGQLKYLEKEPPLFEGFDYRLVHGHTESMIIPIVPYKNKKVAYMADLIPSQGHIPIPYVMGYDVRPLTTMQEKQLFLEEAVQQNFILFFEHDPVIECVDLERTEKGIRAKNSFALAEF